MAGDYRFIGERLSNDLHSRDPDCFSTHGAREKKEMQGRREGSVAGRGDGERKRREGETRRGRGNWERREGARRIKRLGW